jgi:peroxiredoxin Q/BCP
MRKIFRLLSCAIYILGFFPLASIAELKVGEVAPEFTATDHDGNAVHLHNLKGKWVVLYFYPKDDTAGCTIEAKEFTELYHDFLKNGAQVYGISADTKESHCDFRDKYELKIPLIPDEGHKIISLYNVKVSNGYASRDTIVIDPSGKVVKIYRKVNPIGHAKEVLDFIKGSSVQQ